MVVNPEISILDPQRVIRRHRRFKILASGEVIIKKFEIPKLASFLLSPDQLPEQNSREITLKIPTNIGKSGHYPEIVNAVNRIELCD